METLLTYLLSKVRFISVRIIYAYARRVVSYRIDNHMRDELVVESLKTALFKEKPKAGLIIHVDQGSQYTSHRILK